MSKSLLTKWKSIFVSKLPHPIVFVVVVIRAKCLLVHPNRDVILRISVATVGQFTHRYIRDSLKALNSWT
ncbi:unnamed protein product [Macrosiphum euphorbiae]|uniref:Uncharacterized protein n=1 Tax=Macrosiphum euphorbiae TaxID=13131 RepID=A0AAV0X9A1_9HEMI|nr:unnamed protein product [Macrosiphum euphorbiae]